MMEEDEAGLIQRLKNHRESLFYPMVEKHQGRIVKLMGDGALVEFSSVVNATECAIEFQRELQTINQDVPQAQQLIYRIGINLGEVTVDGDDIYGNGVNVAARLESLADAGGILISENVYDQVARLVKADFEHLGTKSVKNIEKPVSVYKINLNNKGVQQSSSPNPKKPKGTKRVLGILAMVIALVAAGVAWKFNQPSTFKPAQVGNMEFSLPDKPSIVVLPFENLSNDAEQEYFVDGITDDLTTDISKMPSLFVIARNSAFSFKNKNADVQKISEELGVRYILQGSVRKISQQIRINTQLIDATRGAQIWAERYDGTSDQVFELQDQISENIISALIGHLDLDSHDPEKIDRTDNLAAYDLFLRGWELYRLDTPEGLASSLDFFRQALEVDPNYSRAHSALAAVYWRTYSNQLYEQVLGVGYSFQALEKAREHLKLAEVNPTPLSYQVSAAINAHYNDIYQFEPIEQAKKAIELDSNDPAGHLALAMAMLKAGRLDEAEQAVREAMRLDPVNPVHYSEVLAMIEFSKGSYFDATKTLEAAIASNSTNHRAYFYLVSCYGHTGRTEEAEIALREANRLREEAGWGPYTLASVSEQHWIGDYSNFKEGLAKAGVPSGDEWKDLIQSSTSNTGTTEFEVNGASTINLEQAIALHDKGVPFVDISRFWSKQRIPGASFLMIWFGGDSEFNAVRLSRVADKDQPVVIYSSGLEKRATNAVAQAVSWGFKNVYYFANGLKRWKAAGLPLESEI